MFVSTMRYLQLCINGECTGSICLEWNLTECFLTSSIIPNIDKRKLCELACQNGTDASTCRGTSEFAHMVGLPEGGMSLRPGSPCDNFQVKYYPHKIPSIKILEKLNVTSTFCINYQTFFMWNNFRFFLSSGILRCFPKMPSCRYGRSACEVEEFVVQQRNFIIGSTMDNCK